MSFEQGTALNHIDLLDRLNAFLTKGHTLAPTYTGTGTGSISGQIGTASSVQETITVTFTGSTAFGVTGSVSGNMGSGTVGAAFSHARVAFTVNAGGTAWAAGDTITFVMTPPWLQKRGLAGSEYIWQAPGNANTDQIFVGATVFSNVSADYYNWRLGGFTGYSSSLAFGAQPGAQTRPCVCLINQAIPYWFIADGRRVMMIAKVSTVYESMFIGLIDAYASPGQWPYPLAVGGSMAWETEPASSDSAWRWSNQADDHSAFWESNSTNISWKTTPLMIRLPTGGWLGFWSKGYDGYLAHGAIWPWISGMVDLRPNLDGSYPLFPLIMNHDYGGSTVTFGEFGGLMATTGHSNISENLHTIGRDSWLVVQNTYRTTRSSYAAFRLA